MKRFLSIFAIMALVVSMFSGVAFADANSVAAAKAALEGATLNPVEFTDTNVLTAAQRAVNKVTTGVVVTLSDASAHADVNDSTGALTYDASETTNNVDFTLTSGVSDTATVSVVVPAATSADACKIVLDRDDNLDYTSTFGYSTITGKIINVADGSLNKDADSTIKIFVDVDKDGEFDHTDLEIESQSADNGVFSIDVETNRIAQLLVVGMTDANAKFDNAVSTNLDIFRILPKVELSTPEELEWVYPQTGQVKLMGVFPNEDGTIKTGASATSEKLTLNFVNANDVMGTAISEANYVDDETFGFLFNGSELNNTADIGLYYDGILLLKGEVKYKDLDVTATEEVVNVLGTQEFTFDFDLSTTYVEEDGSDLKIKSGFSIDYQFMNDDDETSWDDTDGVTDNITGPSGTLMSAGDAFDDADKQLETLDIAGPGTDINFEKWPIGTYKVKVQLKEGSVIVREKTVKFQVARPASFNLMNWDLKEMAKVGPITFIFNDHAVTATTPDQAIVVRDNNNIMVDFLEVTFKGAGVDKKFYSVERKAGKEADEFTFDTTETGTLEVTIDVYSSATDTTIDKTFKKEIDIKGWNIEVSPSEVTVDVETEYTVTVTDQDGNPVNNAKIALNDDTSDFAVDGTAKSIVGGVYTFEKKFTTVGDVKVDAYKASNSQVSLSKGIVVKGEEVYTVTSDTPVLLNGFEQTIYVTVLDENGDIVYPTFTRYDVSVVDGKDDTATNGNPSGSSRKDLDGDGVKEAIKVTVKPTPTQHTLKLRATTDSDKKMGEVSIEVQKPQVVMTASEKVTENFKTALEFQVIDPRDNSVIDKDVYFDADEAYVDYFVYTNDDTKLTPTTGTTSTISADDEVFNCKVFVDDANFTKLEEDEKDAVVALMLDLGGTDDVKLLNLEIGKAKLTSDPETIIMNSSTNLTLTYVDANEKPLEDYKVELGGDEIGKTDENGQVAYATAATSSIALSFTAATDDSSATDVPAVTGPDTADTYEADSNKTSLKVKAGADIQAPTATYELNGTTAIVTINDNVRIAKAMVNGELVDMFFPMPTATHVVTGLKNGVNKVEVLAGDINNNFLQTTLEITVEATAEPVVFTIGEETTYGTPALKGDTTMVPVRFAQDLGAVVEWDDATQTVSYTLGETKISMTISSKTAVVNGENVQLLEAPYKNDAGRTMVPLRMIAKELGFTVEWTSNSAPITIK